MKIKRAPQKASGDLRRFLDAQKVETVVTGPVERYLLSREEKPRREDILHPSELCKNDMCDLAVYYRLIGAKPLKVAVEKPSFQLQRIFDQGTEIHLKWQAYLTGAGILEGYWQCPSTTCGKVFWDVAPMACPRCNHVGLARDEQRTNMIYKEVFFDAEESHLIQGHADGKIGRRILEIKSIGIGTIRVEAPGLLAQHTYKTLVLDEDGKRTSDHTGDLRDDVVKTFVDWEGLWKSIKRPLNSHQRQAHLYVALARMQGIDVDGVVFLYESKWNQSSKEFRVEYNAAIAEPMLEKALDLKYAIEKRKPPRCPHGGCKACAVYEGTDNNEEHRDDQGDAPQAQPAGGDGRGELAGSGAAGEAGPAPARAARGLRAAGTREPLGARRRAADGAVRPADRVGRVPLGAARRR